MVLNKGVAFGFPIGGWWIQMALLPLVIWLWWKDDFKLSSGLLLILIGGLMNLRERVVSGVVRDIIEIPFIGLWINWADILITLGCIIYIWKHRKFFLKTSSSK